MAAIVNPHGRGHLTGVRSRHAGRMRTRTRRRHDHVARHVASLGIATDPATRLSRAGTLLDIPAGATLCREGERGTQAFLLLSGTAQVLTGDGVIRVGAGEVVGEMATLDPRRTRNASVLAETDLEVLVFDVGTYRALARSESLRPHLAPTR